MKLAALLAALCAACSSSEPPRGASPSSEERPAVRDEVVATAVSDEPPGETLAAPVVAASSPVAPVDVVLSCDLPSARRARVGREVTDLVYTRTGGAARRLDLSLPDGEGPFPLVVLVHGGGWRAGEKSHLDEERHVLAGRGYAAASVDYRLVPSIFPAAAADVRCAIRWLRDHAAEHSLDPERVAVAGFSAGGHLAALVGLAPEVVALDDACESSSDVAVQAVIAYFAPLDLRASAEWPAPTVRIIERFLGAPMDRDPTLAAMASPIAHVGAGDPPVLLVHGTADSTVPMSQSTAMRDALEQAGVAVTYVEIEAGRHGFPLFAPRPELRPASCTVLAFLSAHLRPGGA